MTSPVDLSAVSARLLLVADDAAYARSLSANLTSRGYDAQVAAWAVDALGQISLGDVDVVVLSATDTECRPHEVLDVLRSRRRELPVLIVTASETVDERVAALDAGADDVVAAPVTLDELLARIRALRRRALATPISRLQVQDLVMDLVTRRVTLRGQALTLTQREFQLLECLMRREGEVVSREVILREVWQRVVYTTVLGNTIDVHMGRLRRKVNRHATMIHTVRGVGYVMRLPEAARRDAAV